MYIFFKEILEMRREVVFEELYFKIILKNKGPYLIF